MAPDHKLTREQLIGQLNSLGFVFRDLEIVEEGDYSAEDALWNYRDLRHLNVVHAREGERVVYSPVCGDTLSYLLVQSVFGVNVPMTAASYLVGARTLTHYSALGFFVVIVETVFEERAPGGCRVRSIYSIGAPRLLGWLIPLLRWAVRRNNERLMEGDRPMRRRRAQIRSWGYSYRYDGKDFTSVDSLDIQVSNVVLPSAPAAGRTTVDLARELPADGEAWVGKDDHLGLRLVRRGSSLQVFPRLCPHEGASLDAARCEGERLSCPWHGRRFSPVASFELGRPGTIDTEHHRLTLTGQTLEVAPRGA
ncbi:MAG: Rieske 2Fe-2S domain-containing protein [Elusimicrobia bacterium]|nr:Rieske 2Fe-2S domain-containing protein [Elusimicrobiota bacterium]